MRESADMQNIRLIVGLGNPGNEYEHTRHNMGFMCVDEFLAEMPANRFEMENRYDSFFWKGNYSGKVLVMQKPQTYMNLSGNAVVSL